VGGTAWLWADPQALNAVDVLFVDEAGQMPLANVLAASQAGGSVVLLGDPQQLDQPQQGSHPEGADVSALQHMLGDHKTIPSDRGIFLSETWRLAPSICKFTSEVFYEGRLHAHAGLEHQVLVGTAPLEGAGLWVYAVLHDGNQNSSIEEVDAIDRILSSLLRSGAQWIDRDGATQPMTSDDVLVVAPYNSQVALLEERLGLKGVRAGTVDKFQGQEAPVVIYSMTTSAPEDAPHGMEFLYSLNRLNVATSRNQPDIVLMDVCLDGGREGIEAGRWLREVCGVPVVFVTGYDDPDTIERIHERVPGAPVLAKPVYREGLADAVAETIGHSTM